MVVGNKLAGFIQNATMSYLNTAFTMGELTYLIYTDAHPTSGDNPALTGGYAANLATCVTAGHNAGIKVILSVYFDKDDLISLVANHLSTLVTNIVAAIAYADGVDLDIEGYELATHDAQVAATDTLIAALYTQLSIIGKVIILEGYAAMPQAGQNYAVIGISLATAGYLDVIYLMAYDLANPDHSTYNDMVISLESWIAAGFPASKLAPGTALYAKDANGTVIASWGEIVTALAPANYTNEFTVADFTSAIWGYQLVDSPLWVCGYDMTIAKAEYVKYYGFAGMMFFDIGMDSATQNLLHRVYNILNTFTPPPPVEDPPVPPEPPDPPYDPPPEPPAPPTPTPPPPVTIDKELPRVSGLVHKYFPGHYSLEVFIGDVRSTAPDLTITKPESAVYSPTKVIESGVQWPKITSIPDYRQPLQPMIIPTIPGIVTSPTVKLPTSTQPTGFGSLIQGIFFQLPSKIASWFSKLIGGQ